MGGAGFNELRRRARKVRSAGVISLPLTPASQTERLQLATRALATSLATLMVSTSYAPATINDTMAAINDALRTGSGSDYS